jgi:hypothetical protein
MGISRLKNLSLRRPRANMIHFINRLDDADPTLQAGASRFVRFGRMT